MERWARPASVQGCRQEESRGLITNLCLAAQPQSLVLSVGKATRQGEADSEL